MAVTAINVSQFSTMRQLTSAGNTDVITLGRGWPLIQVVNDQSSSGPLTAYVDRGAGQPASYEPPLAGDGTVVLNPGDAYTFGDDILIGSPTPNSVVRIRAASQVTYKVFGMAPVTN